MNSVSTSIGAGSKMPPSATGSGATMRFRDLAAYLGISVGTLYRLKDEDALFRKLVPVFFVGSYPHLLRSDADAYLAALREIAIKNARPKVGRPRKYRSRAA